MLSEGKLRTLIVSGVKSSRVVHLTVYKEGWTPVVIEAGGSQVIKYLGTQYDADYTSAAERLRAEELLKVAAKVIVRTRASAESKAMVMTKSILPKITYACKFGSLTTGDLVRMDSILAEFHRRVSQNLSGHAKVLLYMDKEQMGLGFTSITDAIENDKWGLVIRGLRSADETPLATGGLLERAVTQGAGGLGLGSRSFCRLR